MRPGADTTLKLRLAALSGDAARALGPGSMRDCADVRVRSALAAGLADPAISDRARRELATLADEVGGAEEDGTRSVTLRFRCTEAEAEAIRQRAEDAGLDTSAWLRQVALS